MPATKERSSKDPSPDRIGRASARGLLHDIGEEAPDEATAGRARKNADGLRLPVADDFFERGRPWAVPLTGEEKDAAESLRSGATAPDRALYLWARIEPIHTGSHLDGYRLVFGLGHAYGTLLHHARREPPSIDFPAVETRTGYFDRGEIRRAVERARRLCTDRLG